MGSWLAALRSPRPGGEEQEAGPGSLPSAILTQISKYLDSSDFKSPSCDQHRCLGPFPWIST